MTIVLYQREVLRAEFPAFVHTLVPLYPSPTLCASIAFVFHSLSPFSAAALVAAEHTVLIGNPRRPDFLQKWLEICESTNRTCVAKSSSFINHQIPFAIRDGDTLSAINSGTVSADSSYPWRDC
jgi:hypothetical protein